MKLLIDDCIDSRLAHDLVGHEPKTAREMDWSTLQNDELLSLASQQFDAFITVDRNDWFQQDLGDFRIPVIVLRSRSHRLADLRLLVPRLLDALRCPAVTSAASRTSVSSPSQTRH